MKWLHSHRYSVALIGVAVIVVVGGILVKNNTERTSIRGEIRNVAVEYPYYVPTTDSEAKFANDSQTNPQNAAETFTSPTPSRLNFSDNAPKPREILPEGPATRTVPETIRQEPVKTQNASADNIYSSFFRALSNILSPVDSRTPQQKALFDYGNAAGLTVRNFENSHGDVTQTLKIFFDSRVSPTRAPLPSELVAGYAQMMAVNGTASQSVSAESAAARVQAVADDYARLGTTIAGMQNIPPEANIANEKLAKCYISVGNGLSKMTRTENDAQLLESIYSYNTSAEECVKDYVALVDLFSMHGVKFSASDAGSIFSFNASGL